MGDSVGHYRLLGLVAEGSLGRLYVAEQRRIRDVSNAVALRCVHPDVARQPGFSARFTAVASLAPRLEHPNILSIHEMGSARGSYFQSMEYLPGEDVASILTRCNTGSPVPPDIAAAMVKQAANAVEYVHTVAPKGQPPGFGELGPSTLFVTYHGTVKWLAAGLPSPPEATAALSGEHAVSWSSAFRAPEQAEATPDATAHVFSLGALLWTFLTGHRPHLTHASGGADVAALERGAAPSSIQPNVPEALDAIVMRALAQEPGQRFQSAREMSEALDRYLMQRDGRPTHKHVRRWMEQLFEPERAALQLQIARGRDVGAALAALASLQGGGAAPASHRSSRRARELWSTRHSLFSRPERSSLTPLSSASYVPSSVLGLDTSEAPPTYRAVSPASSAEPPRPVTQAAAPARGRWLLGLVAAGCTGLALGGALLVSSFNQAPSSEAPPAVRRGQLEIQSTPAGAAVFVDGEPTGLRTPAVLKGLAEGRKLRLRVEKAGFGGQERELAIAAGAATTESFELVASAGLVQFAGVPAGGRLFIDDELTASEGGPLRLPVGQHAVRVEAQGSLVFSGVVVVTAGEQTIRVDDATAAP